MRKTSFLLFYLSFLLFACNKNRNLITLSYTNLEEEVPVYGNFTFEFSQNLAADSMLYSWVDDEYIEFSPEIEGKFKWSSANTLIFSPKNALAPAATYTASFSNKIGKVNKDFPNYDLEDIEFSTPNLQLETSDLYWYLNEKGNVAAKLELGFNYEVAAEDLVDALQMKINDKVQTLSIEKTENAKVFSFVLNDLQVVDEDRKVWLSIDKDLLPIGGENTLAENIEVDLLLKSPYQIDLSEVTTDHNGVTGKIIIKSSQEITKENLKNFISLNPNVAFNVETTSNSIIVSSDKFDVNLKYKVTVKKGLTGLIGGKLNVDFEEEVTFGELEPTIEFENSKGMYLSLAGNKNVAIRILNIPEVKVTVYKVYENNLLSANTSENYYYSDDYEGYDSYYGDLQDRDKIWEKTIQTSSLAKLGSTSLLKLDFKDVLKDYKGIYFIRVQSTEDYWLYDAKFISLSDIGLIAKAGQSKISVFANSIKTTESLAGVKIKVFGRNNQLISESITAADGSAQITLKNNNFGGFQPALVTAEKNGDFTLLNLYDGAVETSRFEVGGYYDLPNGLQSFIYLERNLYRPGETVNYAAIVRNQTWSSPGNLPVRVDIINPMGKKLNSYKKTLNNEGSLDGNFTVAADGVTGTYTIYLYSSTDVLLASKNVMIEEFMPDRIKVSTGLSSPELNTKVKTTDLSIFAQNLFGPPAANRNYEVEISYHKKYFSPKEFADYDFNINNTNTHYTPDVREGQTDDAGKASQSINLPSDFQYIGALEAHILTTVFDETGRPVNRKNILDIYTQDVFYGVGDFPYYSSTNSQLNIPLVAVDKNGKAKSGVSAKIQIIKHEYQTVLNKSGDYFRYESNEVEKIVLDKNVTLNGENIFKYTPLLSGEYEIRIFNTKSNGKYVSRYFYAYGYGKTYLSSFEVDNEGRVDIEMDKEVYEVGDQAKILFKTPFQGKMLVTVEAKDVLKHYYISTDKRSAALSIDILEAYLPNVYITATLFKPHVETEFPLTIAHGFQSMKVEDPNRNTPISITAAKNSRSNTQQTIKVKGAPNSLISIAVVDEGILQVGNFSTPNPYDYFYQKRALQVTSADIYPFLLPEISSSSATGGDAGFDLSKRVNPFQNKRVKLVSYWSGLLKTNASGEASYTISIPQFSGNLKIMAVGHKGNSFGSAEANMKVADPMVISTAVPRFLSPGDTAFIAVNLTNTTEKATAAKTSIILSGPLKVLGSNITSVNVNGNKEGRIVYKVYATEDIGYGKITVNCTAFGEVFKEEIDITIRPAVPLVKSSGSGAIASGKLLKLDFKLDKYLSSSTDCKLIISKNPMIEFAKDIDYLVKYPYGCSEQTISAVFPQLYYKDLIESMYSKTDKTENVNQNVMAAINKLKMRQLYNGSISMWENCQSCENWWVTVYTAHFLVEAKKAGFDVDPIFLESTLAYLKNKLKTKETINYYYNNGSTKKIAPKEVSYSLYVLALANKADVSLMNYYKGNMSLLSNDAQYLLSAAYVLAGDKEKGKSLLPNNFENEQADRQFGGSFYSAERDEAIALNALLEVDVNHKDIPIMVKHVSDNLKSKGSYLNTQDRIFSLLALGKFAKLANATTVNATVSIAGKVVGNYQEGSLQFITKDILGKQVEISVKGTGKLYYFWEAEGITKDGSFKQEDSHLKVRRTFYDRYGNPLGKSAFKQNDLVVIKLSVSSDYSNTVDNVVITDMLPAGFEIENPRIDDVPGMQWIKYQAYPVYFDVRDDRILFFDNISTSNGKTQDYYYVVRAVSPGIYKMGPAAADAMYNAEYHSYHGAGWITITE